MYIEGNNMRINYAIEVLDFLKKKKINYKLVSFIKNSTVCLTHDVDSIKSNSILIRKAY